MDARRAPLLPAAPGDRVQMRPDTPPARAPPASLYQGARKIVFAATRRESLLGEVDMAYQDHRQADASAAAQSWAAR
jgi:hypothetical protein